MAPMQQKSPKKWSFRLLYRTVEQWVASKAVSRLRLEKANRVVPRGHLELSSLKEEDSKGRELLLLF
jgi:hypothetical protein